ncbi:MAG: IS110 family transposase [Chitinophagaceae bacterium]
MKKKFFIGIDVSKHTIDVAFIQPNQSDKPRWKVFDNTDPGLRLFSEWLKEHAIAFSNSSLIVIENTGIYHRRLLNFCLSHKLPICVENGAQVKWSLGIARGKSDKVDSRRLAVYAMRFADRLKPASALAPGIQKLKDLISVRSRHRIQLSSLKAYLKELKQTSDSKNAMHLQKMHEPFIKTAQQLIKKIEAGIIKTLQADERTCRQYKLLISVPCIGPITAAYLIACTNSFTNCQSAKQLACYCGVVPFIHQSGISIKGKHQVHKMANKTLKALLHLCALAAIKYVKEFQDYFNRKVLEGKHKMSVINALRNKLVLRAFAVVTNDRPYVDNQLLEG